MRERRSGKETQNVNVDAQGHYTVLLGATLNDGIPLELFSSTEARWLGVRFNRPGEEEQTRVQLVSVPYALRASDAETLGGLPASAYLLDPNAASAGNVNSGTVTQASSISAKSLKPRTISGTMNYIPYFTDNSNDLGNSLLFQSGSNVGIGTASPSAPLDLEADTPYAGVIAARYTGSSSQAPISLPMAVRTARGTPSIPSPVQQGDILGPYVTQAFDGAGFGSAGQIIYWADQNWTSSQHGSYLTLTTVADGTTSATERMRVNNAGNVGIGTTTPGSALDVAGNINLSGSLQMQGTQVLQLSGGLAADNISLGYLALQNNTSGTVNTAIGTSALQRNTYGNSNTAIGSYAMSSNISAVENTAVGIDALGGNNAGSYNTTMGTYALDSNFTGMSNTAIGDGALSFNTTGNGNTAVGVNALGLLGEGAYNIAVGYNAGLCR
jgi:hypothetical protein